MEVPRTKECVVFVSDLSFPVMVDNNMAANGWVGGQAVTWAQNTDDNFMVTYSDGTYGGFLLFGSNESSEQYSSYTRNQPTYNFGVLCAGTWVISTVAYEKYTLESRLAGPLVQNVYTVGQRLRFSLRGLLTPQDEWSISSDPRAPNEFLVASVIQTPNAQNKYHLMVQTAI